MSDSIRLPLETWGRLLGAAMAALWVAGCQAPSPVPDAKAGATRPPIPDPNCGAMDETCPPMMAMVSTGAPMVLEEYGISARFPAGSRVCYGLSGPHAHGFYTRIGDIREACYTSDDPPDDSALSIWADYNAAEWRKLEQLRFDRCRVDDTGDDLLRPNGAPLELKGLRSEACEVVHSDGRLTIEVHAFAGRWSQDSVGRDIPYVSYSAALSTTREKLPKDKAVFARFLDDLALTAPSPDGR